MEEEAQIEAQDCDMQMYEIGAKEWTRTRICSGSSMSAKAVECAMNYFNVKIFQMYKPAYVMYWS